MALTSTIVWRVFSGGANNNGGGWDTTGTGTDWSQQSSAKYALTGIASVGAGNVILSSLASSDMVGNVLNVISGTNYTLGFFLITAVSVGVSITCATNGASASISTGVGVSGVINIGGALATVGSLGSATLGAVAGNVIGVQQGSGFTLTATDTFAASGTSTLPIKIIGYKTTIGDGYRGRTNDNGPLITTNMPSLAYNSTFQLNSTGTFLLFESLNISGNVNTRLLQMAGNSRVVRCKVSNAGTSSAPIAIGTGGIISDCDAALTGAATGGAAVSLSVPGSVVQGSRITVASTSCTGVSAGVTNGAFTISNNTIFGAGSIGVSLSVTSSLYVISGNTITGFTGDGVNLITGFTGMLCLTGNCITDNGGFGLNGVSTANAIFDAYNRYRDNTSGNTNSATGWLAATSYGDVTSGNGTSDYINAAGNDYRLKSTSPAVGAAIPAYDSMGALQQQATSGGGMTRSRTV